MNLTVAFFCFMLICYINAEFKDEREKERDEKIISLLSQASLKMKRNHDLQGILFDLFELLLDVANDVRADFENLKIQKGSAGVGFTATTVGTNTLVKAGRPIPYSRMINEYGKGFGIENSYFVCKIDGLYQFSASICTPTADVWILIYKNNTAVGYLYKDFDSNWGAGSGSTVVRMVKGDKLHLSPNKDIRIHEKVTIISGFRISN